MAASVLYVIAHLPPGNSPLNAPPLLYSTATSSSSYSSLLSPPLLLPFFPPSLSSLNSPTPLCFLRLKTATLTCPKAAATTISSSPDFRCESSRRATGNDAQESSDGVIKGSAAQALDISVVAKKGDGELEDRRVEKRKNGVSIVEVLQALEGLLERPSGSGQTMAAAGGVAVERVKEEAVGLQRRDDVDRQLVFELLRGVQLLEMDLQLLNSARKESTVLHRVGKAKECCHRAILLAKSL